jgi:hypothetical protein
MEGLVMGTRDEPPEIGLGPQDIMDTLFALSPTARYYPIENKAVFLNYGEATDDECLHTLLHEVEHWAQKMFMTDDEILSMFGKISGLPRHEDFILERVNIYKCWFLDILAVKPGDNNYYTESEKMKWGDYWKFARF